MLLKSECESFASQILQEVRDEVERRKASSLRTPALTIVTVGNDPASNIYIRNKLKAAEFCGIKTRVIRLSSEVSDFYARKVMQNAVRVPKTGVIVQLPLPDRLSFMTSMIPESRDLDGLTERSRANLFNGHPRMIPCTAQGVMHVVNHIHGTDLSSLNAVVIGRSAIVGEPVAHLLTKANATVTVCHSKTKELSEHTKNADIIVCAVGHPKLLVRDMVKPGATVIDVGINRTADGRVVGDCDTENLIDHCTVTAVPGGIGKLTVAFLMKNLLLV